MDKLKCTDGPWTCRGKKVFWAKPEKDLPQDNLFNGYICVCASTEDDVPEANDEAKANAAIIAAAPEMYETLVKCLRHITIKRVLRNCELENSIVAVLAKARGEKRVSAGGEQ